VITLLVEPIKADLRISDTAVSVLSGLSFTAFYVLMGLPVARLADRGNRRNIIAVAMLTWSAMTAACGLAWNYWSLLVARAFTGAGEGALSPAAQSMLADYFPKERLPIALGLFSSGIYIGGGLALLVGGAVVAAAEAAGDIVVPVFGALRPWQIAFIAVGAPGILLALVMMCVREPARREVPQSREGTPPTEDLWQQIRSNRSAYIGLFGAFSLLVMQGHGSGTWIPAFFERRFHWSTADIGTAYGLIVLVFGTAGAVAGGLFAGYLKRIGRTDANAFATQLAFIALAPFAIFFALAPNPYLALALMAGMNFFAGFPFAAGYAAIQELTPNRMRARLTAAFVACVNLIGAGLGPTIVALITDHLFANEAMLPYSLALAAAIMLPLAFAFLLMFRSNRY
jgi:MFS family permease